MPRHGLWRLLFVVGLFADLVGGAFFCRHEAVGVAGGGGVFFWGGSLRSGRGRCGVVGEGDGVIEGCVLAEEETEL